ncbi:stage II sporulation protein M [soil metagenome]
MDLDAYSTAHGAEWARLSQLAGQRTLDGSGADELIDRYQSGAAQLSAIKTTVGESVQGDRLSLTLSRARLRFTGAATDPLRQLTVLFSQQLPAALYRVRIVTLVCAALTIIVAVVYAVWVNSDPAVFAALGPESYLRQLAEQDFVGYYSDNSEAGFTGQVWTNNALVAAQCIGFGISGVWVPAALFSNAQGIGLTAGVMAHFGHLDDFFLYIAPHGQLELYTVFTAGAAGLLIFWSWIAPGARTRRQALAEDGRAFFTLVIGCAIFLLMSGLIEGIVTRQPWPWPIKIGIGTVALAIVLVYQWVIGRRAYRAGQTGDLSEVEAGARQIISA